MGEACDLGSLAGGPERRVRVLLAEDDAVTARWTCSILARGDRAIDIATTGDAALTKLRSQRYDILLLDLALPGLDGLGVLEELSREPHRPAVVLVSGYLDTKTTLFALRHGVVEMLEKPLDPKRLLETIEAVEDATAERRSGDELLDVPEIRGSSAAARRLRQLIVEVARHPKVPVLIMGETGTGKELVASAIHRLSASKGPMVALNCAAVPEALFESELFGHEPGSFTGARVARAGLLQVAGDGTVFLDELGEMPASQQAKLLRVLETLLYRRLGSHVELPLEARIISATNRPLQGRRDDSVRSDLFFRLSGYTIRTPPLRERLDDVEILAKHFLDTLAATSPEVPSTLSVPAIAALRGHDWPGNVRELRAVVQAAAVRSPAGHVLGVRPIVEALRDRGAFDDRAGGRRSSKPPSGAFRKLPEIEREAVAKVWRDSGGNLSLAARHLGIPRTTLRDKLKRYGMI
jgi:DNA-binding NtrC family response regulator